ncbi:MAG: hydrogenase accessory protein [Pseudomonadota bacterium]
MSYPLIDALLQSPSVRQVDASTVDDFLSDGAAPLKVLFFTGDPEKKLETGDVAVVLRELVAQHTNEMQAAVVAREAEADLKKREKVTVTPSLAFYANGDRVKIIPKIQDWEVYAAAIPELLAAACSDFVN